LCKWQDKKGNEQYSVYLLPFAPIFPLFISICAYIKYTGGNFWLSFYATILAVCVAVIILSIVDLIDHGLSLLSEKRITIKQKKMETYDQPLLCNGDLSANIMALPAKKRTIYLRFRDLKARVCKPFST